MHISFLIENVLGKIKVPRDLRKKLIKKKIFVLKYFILPIFKNVLKNTCINKYMKIFLIIGSVYDL